MSAHTPGPWVAEAVTSGAKRRDLVYVKIQDDRSVDRCVGYAAVTHGALEGGRQVWRFIKTVPLSPGRCGRCP